MVVISEDNRTTNENNQEEEEEEKRDPSSSSSKVQHQSARPECVVTLVSQHFSVVTVLGCYTLRSTWHEEKGARQKTSSCTQTPRGFYRREINALFL